MPDSDFRMAVFSDVHGNLPALEAVIADINRQKIPVVVNLGDCASSPLWPRETTERLMESGIPTVRGNHDRYLAEGRIELMGHADRFAHSSLDRVHLDWLGALPATIELPENILCCHGTPRTDDKYLLDEIVGGRLVPRPPEKVATDTSSIPQAVILCGHSHNAQVVRLPDGALIVNPGSVGQPAFRTNSVTTHVSESRSPHTRYAVIAKGDAGWTVELHLIGYDHESAARRSLENDRPDWAYALRHGYADPA